MKKDAFYLRSANYTGLLVMICVFLGGLATAIVQLSESADGLALYLWIWGFFISASVLLYLFPLEYFLIKRQADNSLELSKVQLFRTSWTRLATGGIILLSKMRHTTELTMILI